MTGHTAWTDLCCGAVVLWALFGEQLALWRRHQVDLLARMTA